MKNSSYLINCSRGPIINEKDLINALKNNKIAGAGLDVFEKEPMQEDNELLGLKNVTITPHSAFYTVEALERLTTICIDNVDNFINGKPTNIINP